MHFPSYLKIKMTISPLIDKINICRGYSFSQLNFWFASLHMQSWVDGISGQVHLFSSAEPLLCVSPKSYYEVLSEAISTVF